MSELFDDEEGKEFLEVEDDFVDTEDEIFAETYISHKDARKRLENLLEEKRLRDDLEDFLDY